MNDDDSDNDDYRRPADFDFNDATTTNRQEAVPEDNSDLLALLHEHDDDDADLSRTLSIMQKGDEADIKQECKRLRKRLDESEQRRRFLEMLVLDAQHEEVEVEIENRRLTRQCNMLREQLESAHALVAINVTPDQSPDRRSNVRSGPAAAASSAVAAPNSSTSIATHSSSSSHSLSVIESPVVSERKLQPSEGNREEQVVQGQHPKLQQEQVKRLEMQQRQQQYNNSGNDDDEICSNHTTPLRARNGVEVGTNTSSLNDQQQQQQRQIEDHLRMIRSHQHAQIATPLTMWQLIEQWLSREFSLNVPMILCGAALCFVFGRGSRHLPRPSRGTVLSVLMAVASLVVGTVLMKRKRDQRLI